MQPPVCLSDYKPCSLLGREKRLAGAVGEPSTLRAVLTGLVLGGGWVIALADRKLQLHGRGRAK